MRRFKTLIILLALLQLNSLLLTSCIQAAVSDQSAYIAELEASLESADKQIADLEDRITELSSSQSSEKEESEIQSVTYDIPLDYLEGYSFANYDDYNSPAIENGLGGTFVYTSGVAGEFSIVEADDYDIYLTTLKTDDGREWLVILHYSIYSEKSPYLNSTNHDLTICGIYEGFSEVYNLPVIYASKLFDTNTGESLIGIGTMLEYSKTLQSQETQYNTETQVISHENKEEYSEVSYTDVARNPEVFTDTKIKITGKVIQVLEDSNGSVDLRIQSDGDIWYVTYTRPDGESRILEDDQITCYGECIGVVSYKSVLGSTITIPGMEMQFYELSSQNTAEEAFVSAMNQTEAVPVEKIIQYEITYNNIKVWENSIGTMKYQGIVEITNTGNTDLYLSSGKFDIENEDGALFASRDSISVYPQIIKPGEKAYYYDCSTLDNADSTASYKIVPKINAKEATKEQIYLTVSDFRLEDKKYGGLKAIGRVENTTDVDQTNSKVAVICYDSSGVPIAVIFSYADALAPGEKVGEELSESTVPPGVTASSVAEFTVYVYPHQYQW